MLHSNALAAAQDLAPILGTCVQKFGGVFTEPLAGSQLPESTEQAGSLLGVGGFGAVNEGVLLRTGSTGEVSLTRVAY